LTGQDDTVLAPPDGHKPLSHSPKSVKKRDAILRAATEIINVKGYALATMTEIGAALDLRDAALYYYFPNKQALVFACHQSSLERFERVLSETNESGGAGFERLERFLRALLMESARNGPLLYFGDRSYLDENQRDAIAACSEQLTRRLERVLQEGMDDGSITSCESSLVVQLLLGMLIWLAKWVPTVEGMTVDRLMAAIGVTALHGLDGPARAS
jgi:AcrR family transcriptional regulator